MDSDHQPPDDANRGEAGTGPAADQAETATGSNVESGRNPPSSLGDDARSRLAGDRPGVEHGASEESSPAADAEAYLKRAFPGGEEETSSRPEPTDDASLYRSDIAEVMHSVDAVDDLLALGRGCAAEGDWSGVQGVLDAIGIFDPTRVDQVRAVGVYHAVARGEPNVGRDFANGMGPGRAQDGWTRYVEGDVDLPRHHVGRRDGLWGIAERYLGDGRRWREIHDINVGRPQPDGRHLSAQGEDIRQGWILVLPPDARRSE